MSRSFSMSNRMLIRSNQSKDSRCAALKVTDTGELEVQTELGAVRSPSLLLTKRDMTALMQIRIESLWK